MMGALITNEKVYWSEVSVYRLAHGKFVELWVEGSTMELLQQIGSLPRVG